MQKQIYIYAIEVIPTHALHLATTFASQRSDAFLTFKDIKRERPSLKTQWTSLFQQSYSTTFITWKEGEHGIGIAFTIVDPEGLF